MSGFPFLGSCSTGTLLSHDLIPNFCHLLNEVLNWAKDEGTDQDSISVAQSRLEVIGEALDDSYYFASSDSYHDYEWLLDALNEFAPENVTFGSLEGDGADFGFWEDAPDEGNEEGDQE